MKRAKQRRRGFDQEFKRNAVEAMRNRGERQVKDIAEEIGVAPSMLARWAQAYPASTTSPTAAAPETETEAVVERPAAAAALLALTSTVTDTMVGTPSEDDAAPLRPPVRQKPGPKPGSRRRGHQADEQLRQGLLPWKPREVSARYAEPEPSTPDPKDERMVEFMRKNTERALRERDALATVLGMMMEDPALFGRKQQQ